MYGVLLIMMAYSSYGGMSITPYKIMSTTQPTFYQSTLSISMQKCHDIGQAFLHMQTRDYVHKTYTCVLTEPQKEVK